MYNYGEFLFYMTAAHTLQSLSNMMRTELHNHKFISTHDYIISGNGKRNYLESGTIGDKQIPLRDGGEHLMHQIKLKKL